MKYQWEWGAPTPTNIPIALLPDTDDREENPEKRAAKLAQIEARKQAQDRAKEALVRVQAMDQSVQVKSKWEKRIVSERAEIERLRTVA